MNIGIEEHTKLIYEGASLRFGYPLWPSPMMFQVVIASEDDDVFTPAKQNDLAPHSYIFRSTNVVASAGLFTINTNSAGAGEYVLKGFGVNPTAEVVSEKGEEYQFLLDS